MLRIGNILRKRAKEIRKRQMPRLFRELQMLEQRVLLTAQNPLDLGMLDGSDGTLLDSFSGSVPLVRAMGDVNGDGFDDAVLSDFSDVYVVFGDPAGLGANADVSMLDGSDGFRISSATLINDVTTADVNDDGFSDVVIGQANANSSTGQAVVLFGKSAAFGATVDLDSISATDGFAITGEVNFGQFGRLVANAGDVNGDQVDDLIFDSQDGIGRATVVFGNRAGFGTGFDISNIDGTNGFHIRNLFPQSTVYNDVNSAGDVNGDGFDDVVVTRGSVFPQVAHVIFGGDTFSTNVIVPNNSNGSESGDLNGTTGFTIDNQFGVSATGADINNDGFSDVIIGRGNGAGATVILGKGTPFDPRVSVFSPDGSAAFQLTVTDANERLGESVAAVGDINADGIQDFAIGAPGINSFSDPLSNGRVYTVFGSQTPTDGSVDLTLLDGNNGFRSDGTAVGQRAGVGIAGGGDQNGDGFDDMLFGTSTTRAYLVNGLNFTDSVDLLGDSNANTLTGTSGAEVINGAQGDDVLTGLGGADLFFGGSGADTIVIPDLNWMSIDGDSGNDTIQITGDGINLDLTSPVGDRIHSVEGYDIAGTGGVLSSLLKNSTLDARQIIDILSL